MVGFQWKSFVVVLLKTSNGNMSNKDIVFPFTGGYDRSITTSKADPASFYEMLNFRQSRSERGRIEQTPYFSKTTSSQGTYYKAGSLTEPAGAAFYGIDDLLTFTAYVMRNLGSQIPIVYQSTIPSGTTIYKHCLLVIENWAGFGLTLGSTADIEIDGVGATFRWRKNGGGWTAGVACSTTGTSIDGGNATVYFLASSGFAVTDTWSFQRTDYMVGPETGASQISEQIQTIRHKNNVYFINANGRVMYYNGTYARSVGYRPVYGTSIAIFEDHLFVGQGLKDSLVSGSGVTSSETAYCSDRSDFDCFFESDINEADTFTFPQTRSGSYDSTALRNITWGIINDTLYCFTASKIYTTTYQGLPIPFNFKEFASFPSQRVSTKIWNNVVQAKDGVYILRNDGPWFFNGSNFDYVGRALGRFIGTSTDFRGTYDFGNNELVMLAIQSGSYLVYTFSESYRTWSKRNVYFDQLPSAIAIVDDTLKLGGSSLSLFVEDTAFSATPVYDNNGAFTIPTLTTQMFTAGGFRYVKETSSAVISATVETAGANYYTGSAVKVTIKWYVANNGAVPSVSSDTNATWTNARTDGLISYPRVAFRGILYSLLVEGTDNTKPPGIISLYQLEPLGNWGEPKAVR